MYQRGSNEVYVDRQCSVFKRYKTWHRSHQRKVSRTGKLGVCVCSELVVAKTLIVRLAKTGILFLRTAPQSRAQEALIQLFIVKYMNVLYSACPDCNVPWDKSFIYTFQRVTPQHSKLTPKWEISPAAQLITIYFRPGPVQSQTCSSVCECLVIHAGE